MQRKYIIDAARSWIGTKFHHQGRVKKFSEHKGGCDCMGLIMGVAKELNLKSFTQDDNLNYIPFADFDYKNYQMIPNVTYIKKIFDDNLQIIDKDNLNIGDIILMMIENRPQHLAFYNQTTIIHCNRSIGFVAEQSIDKSIRGHILSGWKFNF